MLSLDKLYVTLEDPTMSSSYFVLWFLISMKTTIYIYIIQLKHRVLIWLIFCHGCKSSEILARTATSVKLADMRLVREGEENWHIGERGIILRHFLNGSKTHWWYLRHNNSYFFYQQTEVAVRASRWQSIMVYISKTLNICITDALKL